MIIIMSSAATTEQISRIVERIERDKLDAHLSQGEERTIIGVVGDDRQIDRTQYLAYGGVEKIVPILKPFKLSSRTFQAEDTVINIKGAQFGGAKVEVIAGPCAIESEAQILEIANTVKALGATALRGGAFQARTSPYSFQGLGEQALKYLKQAGAATGLATITSVNATEQVERVASYVDVLEISASNTQNYALLKAVGKTNKPVLLRRGKSVTVEELLMAAEYILAEGNPNVMLCERGIRTFETYTRNTADINAIPLLKQLSHLPVLFDPCDATGQWELVTPMARAAVAAGADGLIIEVHPDPEEALCDGPQSLKPELFGTLVTQIRAVATAIGRS